MVKFLPFYNNSYGRGMEGFFNYSNSIVNNWFVPVFLLILYGLTLYVYSKSEYKFGGVIMLTSVSFFIISMIAQAFVTFNQLIIFLFALMIGVGALISFFEGR